MLPLNKARLAAETETLLARSGRHTFEVQMLEFQKKNPTEPCTHCFGEGRYAENNGERRPFDHKTFSEARGDRYEASCPVCRGGKRVPCSPARAEEAAKQALEVQRAEYREIRKVVASTAEITWVHFDRIVKKRISGEPSPAKWVEAAHYVASFLGVEV